MAITTMMTSWNGNFSTSLALREGNPPLITWSVSQPSMYCLTSRDQDLNLLCIVPDYVTKVSSLDVLFHITWSRSQSSMYCLTSRDQCLGFYALTEITCSRSQPMCVITSCLIGWEIDRSVSTSRHRKSDHLLADDVFKSIFMKIAKFWFKFNLCIFQGIC